MQAFEQLSSVKLSTFFRKQQAVQQMCLYTEILLLAMVLLHLHILVHAFVLMRVFV